MANDPEQTRELLASLLSAAWWTGYSVALVLWYILIAMSFVAQLLYRPIAFVLSPLIYIGRLILACVVFPFDVIAKFQDIYIYVGTAAIVGVVGGLFVRSCFVWLRNTLGLEDVEPQHKGRTVKQYRQDRRRQKLQAIESPLLSSGHLSPGALSPGYVSMSDSARKGKRQRSLISSTIMEEGDSDF